MGTVIIMFKWKLGIHYLHEAACDTSTSDTFGVLSWSEPAQNCKTLEKTLRCPWKCSLPYSDWELAVLSLPTVLGDKNCSWLWQVAATCFLTCSFCHRTANVHLHVCAYTHSADPLSELCPVSRTMDACPWWTSKKENPQQFSPKHMGWFES